MRKHLRLIPILALILCTALLVLPVQADVGNVDWGDYGGGGGYDDYGGGYDYGYGGGYYYDDGGDWSFGFSDILITIVIIAVILLFVYLRSKASGNTAAPVQTVDQCSRETVSADVEQRVIAQIRAVDPEFAAEQFKSWASDVFLRVQEAWEAKDWSVIRPIESDKLFNLHQRQLQELIDQKKTNHMDGQYIKSVTLAAFVQDGANQALTVRLDAMLSDYTTDDQTGQVITGSKTTKYNRSYRLTFIRSSTVKTQAATDEVKSHSCPSCGAPLELNASGKCEYCGCVVTSGEYGWVLNEYNRW